MKKILTLILVLAAVLSVSGIALAEEAVTLDIAKGSIVITETGYSLNGAAEVPYAGNYVITQTNATTATANTITVNGIEYDKTITLNGVNMSGITSMINVKADATLLLENTNSVISDAVKTPTICIDSGKTLVIDGTGSLTVKGGSQSAGIGGKGNLVIDGGNISAVGKGGAAAIGGCYGGSYNIFGSITINDGTVTISKDEGAEFSGICPVANTAGGGNVTINGGKINISLKYAQDYAAIGGGKASNAFTGDVIINGGEITVDVTAHANQYAIRTAGAFKMTGGTLVEIKKFSSSTRDYITASSVSITGGNVKEYYKEPTDSNGRKLTKLYIVDANGTPVTSEVTIKEGSHEWSAVPDANGVITTYLADETTILTYKGESYPVTPGKDSTVGVLCTCADGGSIAWTGVPAEITLYSGDTSKTVALSAEFVKASICLAPVHPVDVKLSLTGEANGCTLTDGNLTINRSTVNYELTLSAVAGTLATDTKTIKVNCVTDKGLDIANGYVEVVAGTEAGTVTYKQNDAVKYENVSASEPVTITGSYNLTSGNAITITKCSPTIILKDLTIESKANDDKNAESTILIDGEKTDEVKLILSGTNRIIRGDSTHSSHKIGWFNGIEIRNATLTIDCECENGADCKDTGCTDKLVVTLGNGRSAAIGSRWVQDWGTDNVNEPEGFTLNIEGGQIEASTENFGAAIGTSWISGNVPANVVTLNFNDGYVKAVASDVGVAIGSGRSDNEPNNGIMNVNIAGGVVDAVSVSVKHRNDKGETNSTSFAINASNVEISGDADATVKGVLRAKEVEVTDDASLDIQKKEGWSEDHGFNPGGSIGNGAEWVNSATGETVVKPGNVDVKVSDGATLTTAGGINGSLSTSGNATANINGVAPQSGKAGTDKNVGGVSGNVTVGAGSTVSVAEDVRGDVTVEKGATFNAAKVEGDVAVGEGASVNVGEVGGTVDVAPGATYNGRYESYPYSGPSIWYIGGNTFGTSTTQMPTSVEIDNVSVPFSMEGSNIVVSCINPGARWATVKWNSTSATINFNPDVNVVCAEVAIPKTGDMPIWAAIAEFLGF